MFTEIFVQYMGFALFMTGVLIVFCQFFPFVKPESKLQDVFVWSGVFVAVLGPAIVSIFSNYVAVDEIAVYEKGGAVVIQDKPGRHWGLYGVRYFSNLSKVVCSGEDDSNPIGFRFKKDDQACNTFTLDVHKLSRSIRLVSDKIDPFNTFGANNSHLLIKEFAEVYYLTQRVPNSGLILPDYVEVRKVEHKQQ